MVRTKPSQLRQSLQEADRGVGERGGAGRCVQFNLTAILHACSGRILQAVGCLTCQVNRRQPFPRPNRLPVVSRVPLRYPRSAVSARRVLIRDIILQTVARVGCSARRGGEPRAKRERDNFVLALAGATLNCGLPTLINFGRFISPEPTRRWKGGVPRHSVAQMRTPSSTSFSAPNETGTRELDSGWGENGWNIGFYSSRESIFSGSLRAWTFGISTANVSEPLQDLELSDASTYIYFRVAMLNA